MSREIHVHRDPCGFQRHHRDNRSRTSVRRGSSGAQNSSQSDHLSLQNQNQTKAKPKPALLGEAGVDSALRIGNLSCTQNKIEKTNRVYKGADEEHRSWEQTTFFQHVGAPCLMHLAFSSLCALTSGQCLLSQSPFGRLLWEKNFVVVLQKRRGMRKHEKEEAS